MRRNLILLVTCVFAVLAVIGCVEPGQKATPLPPTKTPKPTFTLTPNITPTPLVLATATKPPATSAAAATATPAPSPTAVPPTVAPTAPPAPKLTTHQNVNVRSGPGTNYNRLGELGAGQTFDITGKNPAGDWYQFNYSGQAGWVRNDFVTLSGDAGGIKVAENIPAPPPTPRPAPPPQPTAPPPPPAVPPPPAPTYDWAYVAGSAIAAPQCDTPHFDGQAQYKNGSPANGVCIVVDYFGPRQLKYSGSGGKGDGNWGFSPCGRGDCKGDIYLYVVQCPPNVPDGGLSLADGGVALNVVSDKFKATITDKCQAGQWEGIIFRNTRQ
jgi:hypothetical protein